MWSGLNGLAIPMTTNPSAMISIMASGRITKTVSAVARTVLSSVTYERDRSSFVHRVREIVLGHEAGSVVLRRAELPGEVEFALFGALFQVRAQLSNQILADVGR